MLIETIHINREGRTSDHKAAVIKRVMDLLAGRNKPQEL